MAPAPMPAEAPTGATPGAEATVTYEQALEQLRSLSALRDGDRVALEQRVAQLLPGWQRALPPHEAAVLAAGVLQLRAANAFWRGDNEATLALLRDSELQLEAATTAAAAAPPEALRFRGHLLNLRGWALQRLGD